MTINSFTEQEIEVTSVYFKNSNKGFESYPKSMVYEGHEYNFIEEGLRYLINTKDKLVKLFDVSDGQVLYRLRLDGNRWTLVRMTGV
ncbi:MAG TPA: hypothetical protein VFN31_01500 [Candidatus Saccharimonadales bacterium]|nr:hypothetical protein [Candidatus Saccharimonadales bacterium]